MKKIDKEALGELAARKIKDAISMGSSKLAKEREKVMKYYAAQEPKPQHAGSASYISSDVYDAVEAMKAQLLEVFGAGEDIVRFTPQGPEDVEPARIATAYTNYVLFRKNDGFRLFQDVIHDGLMARVGIAKVYWENRKEHEDHSFEGMDELSVDALNAQPNVIELDSTQGEDGTYSGVATIEKDSSQVVIEAVAPESFGIDPQAKDLKSFHFHKVARSKGELKADGFNVKLLEGVSPDADEWDDTQVEVDARFGQINDGLPGEETKAQRYWVYECYMYCPHDDGRDVLYKIVRVGDATLACDEVDRSPFHVFTPLRASHSFFGQNFAQRVVPFQNARTVLARGILDHTAMTSNPRYLVANGGLTNPRELLENRLGGIVNVRTLDSVVPMPQSSLNPFVFNAMSLLKQEGEETTGISSLSQGMNKDAISKQNSQGMVNDLVDLSMTRQKIIARNFANGFLAPLFTAIYRLVLENMKSPNEIISISGNWVPIDPTSWIERKDAVASMHLSPGDDANEANKLVGLLQLIAQDPFLSKSLGAKGRYNAAVQIFRANGIKNTADFLTPPQDMQPDAPDPMMMKQIELQERQVAAQEMGAQAAAQKMAVDAEVKKMKLELEAMRAERDAALKRADSHRRDMMATSEIDARQREVAMLEEQTANPIPGAEPRGIISPS